MSNPWAEVIAAISADDRRALLEALLTGAGGDRVTLLDQRLVATPDDCLEQEIAVPQWTAADGRQYGVRIRALRYRDRMEAEIAATQTDRAGKATISPWRLMAEEVARAILRPRVTVDQILDWNDDVVRHLYSAIHRLAPLPPAMVLAELARHAGEPAPEPQRGGGNADAVPPGRPDGSPAAGSGADGHGDPGDGDRGGAVGGDHEPRVDDPQPAAE